MSRLTHLFVLLCVVLLASSSFVRASDSDSDSDSGVDVDVDVDAEAHHTAEVHTHHEAIAEVEHEHELEQHHEVESAAPTGAPAPATAPKTAPKKSGKKPNARPRAVPKPDVKITTAQRCANVTNIAQYRVVVPLFNSFIARYKRNYTTVEYNNRLCVYALRIQKILDHNTRFKLGLETYQIATTKLADVTKEKSARFKGLVLPPAVAATVQAKERPNPFYGKIKNIKLKPKAKTSAKGAKAKRFMFRQKSLEASSASASEGLLAVGSTPCQAKGGQCWDMVKYECGTGSSPQRGLCPGPANIKCCLPDNSNDDHYVVAPVDFTGSTTVYDWSANDVFNWVTKGFNTPVQNQGQCGSCWAFTAAAAMEGWNWRKTGALTPISAQAVLDCTNGFGQTQSGVDVDTCKGGWYHNAINWARANGANAFADYPYKMAKGSCAYNAAKNVLQAAPIAKSVPFIKATCPELLKQLEQGPVPIAMECSDPKFSLYGGGMYIPERVLGQPDHAMLLVGHGVKDGVQYAIIKNQWGDDWGEKGYIRTPLNALNICDYPAFLY